MFFIRGNVGGVLLMAIRQKTHIIGTLNVIDMETEFLVCTYFVDIRFSFILKMSK